MTLSCPGGRKAQTPCRPIGLSQPRRRSSSIVRSTVRSDPASAKRSAMSARVSTTGWSRASPATNPAAHEGILRWAATTGPPRPCRESPLRSIAEIILLWQELRPEPKRLIGYGADTLLKRRKFRLKPNGPYRLRPRSRLVARSVARAWRRSRCSALAAGVCLAMSRRAAAAWRSSWRPSGASCSSQSCWAVSWAASSCGIALVAARRAVGRRGPARWRNAGV